MVMRSIALCVMILCFASLFVGLPFAAAQSDTEDFETTLLTQNDLMLVSSPCHPRNLRFCVNQDFQDL